MRQLTKELASYAWVMSAFGAQQVADMAMWPRRGEEHPTTKAFRAVTECADQQLYGIWRPLFHTGDTVQRWMIDLTFNVMSFRLAMPGTGERQDTSGHTETGGR